MLSRIAQQVLIWSLIVLILIWGYVPSLWNMGWPAYTLGILAVVALISWGVVGLANLRSFFAQRSSQFGISLLISAVSMLAILVAVNYAANLYNQKKDITSTQLYSLSDQSKRIAAQVKEPIEIEVWTTNIQRMTPNQDLQRFLENYKIESHGKIKISVRNPNEDLTAKERNVTKDNVIVFRASSGREARIENVNQEKIEEQITNSIVQTIKGVKKVLCFTKDHGELSIDEAAKAGMSQIKQSLEASSYQTKSISITNISEIPAECEALVIAGPKSEPTDSGIVTLRHYLASNGKAIIMLGAASPQKWNDLIKPYGVEFRNDIILDMRVQPPTAVATQNFSRENEIVKSFDRMVVMFQSASLAIPTSGKSGEFSVKAFVSSEPHTFAKKKNASGTVKTQPEPSDMKGPLALAVLVENPAASAKNKPEATGPDSEELEEGHDLDDGHGHGSNTTPLSTWLGIKSAWAQNPKPVMPVPVVPRPAPAPAEKPASSTKLIVIGNDLFASNAFVNQLGNLDLFMNSVSYLLEDHDVIGIRPRELKATRLQLSNETDRQVQATVYLLAGLCFLGALRAASRRRKMSV